MEPQSSLYALARSLCKLNTVSQLGYGCWYMHCVIPISMMHLYSFVCVNVFNCMCYYCMYIYVLLLYEYLALCSFTMCTGSYIPFCRPMG